MDGKKQDDYGNRMADMEMQELNDRDGPKEPFLARSNSRPAVGGGLSLPSNITNNPGISILAYCLASISMTVVNKYCVSGADWNLNFFYLAIQVWRLLL